MGNFDAMKDRRRHYVQAAMVEVALAICKRNGIADAMDVLLSEGLPPSVIERVLLAGLPRRYIPYDPLDPPST